MPPSSRCRPTRRAFNLPRGTRLGLDKHPPYGCADMAGSSGQHRGCDVSDDQVCLGDRLNPPCYWPRRSGTAQLPEHRPDFVAAARHRIDAVPADRTEPARLDVAPSGFGMLMNCPNLDLQGRRRDRVAGSPTSTTADRIFVVDQSRLPNRLRTRAKAVQTWYKHGFCVPQPIRWRTHTAVAAAAASESHLVSTTASTKAATDSGSPGKSATADPRQMLFRLTEPTRRPSECSSSS